MKHRIEYAAARLFIAFLQLLPVGLSLWTGAMLGRLFYVLDRRHREIALNNLASALGREKSEKERKQIARGSFENLGRSVAEICRLQRAVSPDLQKRIEIEGWDHYRSALDQGKGVICLTAHFGNWELAPAALSFHDFQMYFVARALDNPYLNRMLNAWRERNGNRILNKKTASDEIVRLLRKGATVGFLLDQNTARKEAVFVDYFGMPAATHKGLAILALRTGAPVVPAFIIRQEERHKLIIEKPLEPVRTGRLQNDIYETTALFTKKIESYVRQYPDQWLWVHRRWKTKRE
ncbi:MAG TPA: lysophospholipid acyltransferase family protein [Candidatus Manganitrophaceae bacterium]|nr:lysophospholipid acyltransferase family protein [Candidatus Manganitrophaceae bacterium]